MLLLLSLPALFWTASLTKCVQLQTLRQESVAAKAESSSLTTWQEALDPDNWLSLLRVPASAKQPSRFRSHAALPFVRKNRLRSSRWKWQRTKFSKECWALRAKLKWKVSTAPKWRILNGAEFIKLKKCYLKHRYSLTAQASWRLCALRRSFASLLRRLEISDWL